jgi:putative acetyltransferase
MNPTIRPETPDDFEAIRQVNREAFAGEQEATLVDALRSGGFVQLSLVAVVDTRIVGHLLFSDLPIRTDQGTISALSLAPMAVLPAYQRNGIGTALIERGLAILRERNHRIVVVLGHAEYYPRFGFSAKAAEPLLSPFPAGPHWMALELVPGALNGVRGSVCYPPPFGIEESQSGSGDS